MKAIGIGGAGSKIAVVWDPSAVTVNISEVELNKVNTEGTKILAALRGSSGAFKGARMDPAIGYEAYNSVKRELQSLVRGALVFSATGGGTGSGITKGILEDLIQRDADATEEKTLFGLVLPYARLEAEEFIRNTSEFMSGPVAAAIDNGSTGNIFMFSNRTKFEQRIPEARFNEMLVESLNDFFAIPKKNEELKLLDEHIDQEDFALFLSKPFFNHFTSFNYNPNNDFGKQLNAHHNPLLIAPEDPIEAMFFLEVPEGGDSTIFYNIIEYFNQLGVKPIYSVAENPAIKSPHVTVSLLYSRKPAELVQDFNKVAEEQAQTKVRKTIDQFVQVEQLQVNLEDEARKVNEGQDDIVAMLKRLHKI
jgi:hypothetical protein